MSTTTGFELHRPGAASAPADPGAAAPGEPLLPADARLQLTDDPAATQVGEVLRQLDDELVGLAAVRRRIAQIAALLLVDRARSRFGLAASRPCLHMSFTGSPGTGKTTVALRMAEILHVLGYVRTPRVHAVTRDDLVGQFIGHTAPKTKEALARAAGGVLFIDEAYYLYRPENERDYGQETIEILLQEMESERSSLVVIFAGYPDRMERFFACNPGLSSRVAHHIAFDDYRRDELADIATLMLRRDGYQFDAGAKAAFEEYLERRMGQPRFANARSVRNALERCRLRQADRLVTAGAEVGRDELMTFTEQDVRSSSLFGAPAPEPG